MKSRFASVLLLLATMSALAPAALAAPPAPAETPAQRDARMRWWREAKFGLFIHWGVYAVPAGKYREHVDFGEWIMHEGKIPVAEYQAFAKRFNPVKYDPAAWAKLAKEAGMRYVVITSKHHDGFALFPTEASKWNVIDASPYGRDLLGPLAQAVRREQLKIGFYYSEAQDWNNPGGAKAGFNEGDGWDPAHRGDFDRYLTQVAVPQVRELLTRYHPDILWWDTPQWMTPARARPLAELLHAEPGIITNNRLGGEFAGDTATPEQFVPATGFSGDWETCMTMNDHWGYNAADQNWKSAPELIRKLAEICSKGGNFLLNVGPTAEGEIPEPSVERLQAIGRWLSANGESIYGTKAGPFPHLSWGVATRKADRLFLHGFRWPADRELRVPLRSAVGGASLLASPDQPLPVRREADRVIITVPESATDPVNSVVVLELAAEPEVAPIPSLGRAVKASSAEADRPAANLLDGTGAKVWTAAATDRQPWVEIDLGASTAIGGFAFDEPDVWPRLRQHYRLQVADGDGWKTVLEGDTIGHGTTADFAPVTAQKFRLQLERKDGAPSVAEWQLYRPE